ncbi:DUF5050 domain-containing protein [Bradyrhizobium sp.]|uniref:DUF5050 domain-containing protein n=1 Tax=Bradyrhizobium sp. TaxID=376 RepID=UPI003BBFAAD2
MIYFQGTDNTLWQLNPDGSGGAKVAGFQCKSPPVAYGSHLYFQGTDNTLWISNLDGSQGVKLGGNTTSSAPFVTATGVYFRGTDNKLWAIGLDGTNQVNLGNNTTNSTPFVLGQYVFFQGTDNRLWRILIDGTQGINLGDLQTSSSPFATAQYVFCRGTDNKLWRMNLDGTNAVNLGGYQCNSTPCAAGEFVYFQGTDNTFWRVNLDGTGGFTMAGWKCKSSPVVDTSQNYIYFQGTDNSLWRTGLEGENGVHLGGFNTASPPFVVQPSNQPVNGSGRIPYIVLLVVYAPPGTNEGKSNSQVQYSTGSIVGSTLSYATSSMNKWGVTASAKDTTSGGDSWTIGAGYSNTSNSGYTSTLDIRNTTTTTLTVPGPGADGINHDYDLIYLLLNPTMNVIVDPRFNMNWSLDFTGDEDSVVYIQMNWLKDLSLFQKESPNVYARCISAGMTATDFAQLLALDPMANGQTGVDGGRYVLTNLQFTYEPPGAGATSPILSEPVTYAVTYTGIHQTSSSWGLDVSASASGTLGKALSLTVGGTDSFSMTNTTTVTATNGETQTVTPTIGGPAAGYAGPTRLQVYQDVLYGTLMFYLVDDPVTYTGVLHDATGKVLANTAVKLTIGSQVLYSWTDSSGTYRFYGTPKGAVGQISAVAGNAGTIEPVLNLNGKWASGGTAGPVISVNGSSIVVDMSAYHRPTARGSIVNSTTITVNFPDDKTYTGVLQPPNTIKWSNNSSWTKV